jgi:RNA polymerase sigma factor (sigma-70 family)
MATTQRRERNDAESGLAARTELPLEGRARFEQEALVHLDAMYSFALKLSRSRDDAEDLVSDTVLRAFERWEQYRLGTNIRAWLFTILYHVFVSRKRRIDAREVQATDETDGWGAFEPVGELNPEARFYETFLDAEITTAIDNLPDESPVPRPPHSAEEAGRLRNGHGLYQISARSRLRFVVPAAPGCRCEVGIVNSVHAGARRRGVFDFAGGQCFAVPVSVNRGDDQLRRCEANGRGHRIRCPRPFPSVPFRPRLFLRRSERTEAGCDGRGAHGLAGAVAGGFGAVAAGGHVAPATAAVLGAVEEHAAAAWVAAATDAAQFTGDQ